MRLQMANKEVMYNCRKAQLLESLMCGTDYTECNHSSQICFDWFYICLMPIVFASDVCT